MTGVDPRLEKLSAEIVTAVLAAVADDIARAERERVLAEVEPHARALITASDRLPTWLHSNERHINALRVALDRLRDGGAQ